MSQGWYITTAAGGTITFYEPPPAGANNISVTQNPVGGSGGTDVWALGAWSPEYGYPSEVEFFGDRLWFAGSPRDPQTLWASCIGDYNNFGRSSPIVDSDAVSFTNNARQVNVITDLTPLDSLMVMTTGGEFKTTGGANEVVTPSTVGLKNQSNYGSGAVPAKVIGESALFLQDEGSKLRDLRYQFEKDGFRGTEIGIWADHLFEGFSFTNIEYWKSPWSVVWLDREDGIRVGCTYMPEQEVNGFHWHDTDGEWLNTCALPGKPETECYYLARRVIGGEVVQYVEQQAPTKFFDESELWFVDSGLMYDGRNLSATTITLTSASGNWTEDDEITITSGGLALFFATDVGDAIVLRRTVTEQDEDGNDVEVEKSVRVFIDQFDDPFFVKGHSIGSVQEALRGYTTTDWTFQRDTIGGLWHLEGKQVRVLRDSAAVGPFTVENGQITLDTPGGVVIVGLGYTGEIVTLELNNPGGESMRDQRKLTYEARLTVLNTRGVSCGPVNGPWDPIKDRSDEPYGRPPYLRTGVRKISISAEWGVDAGQVRCFSEEPLPMEILALSIKATASN
jgi:hypothetical protein